MVANEVNKFGQIFPIHRRRKYKNILLISATKVLYTELICVKDTPHFFPNLFQNHPVCLICVVEQYLFLCNQYEDNLVWYEKHSAYTACSKTIAQNCYIGILTRNRNLTFFLCVRMILQRFKLHTINVATLNIIIISNSNHSNHFIIVYSHSNDLFIANYKANRRCQM
jgi:hypothetical protein